MFKEQIDKTVDKVGKLFLVGFRNIIFACLNSQSVAPTVGGVYLQMVSGKFIDRNIAPGQDACGVLQTKLCNYMQTFNTYTCKHIHICLERTP